MHLHQKAGFPWPAYRSRRDNCLKILDEAEVLLLDAQRVLKDIPGAQGQEAKATAARLSALYEAWGRPKKAAPYGTNANNKGEEP